MAQAPDQLTRVENALRKGLRDGAAAWLDDFLRRYQHGGLTDGAGATCVTGLTAGLQQAWLTAWMLSGRELAAIVRQRFPARTVRSLVQEPVAGGAGGEPPPSLSLPAPLPLPADFRTWLETHTVAEGGTAKVPVPRSGAEWLAEHEATVNKWVPREYVDRYLRTRVPPLVGIADAHLLEAARDMVAANVERGFGVRETMRSLRRDFPSFAARRLENIAHTEGATCYEHGRLARYMADGLVTGVTFSAVGGKQGDGRTTEICKGLHGRAWKLDDPNKVTPPAHYLCRSTLLPVLFNEQPEWQSGPVPEEAQPLEGFGTVDPALLPPNRTPEDLFGRAPEADWHLPSGPAVMPAYRPAAASTRRVQDDIAAGRRKWDEGTKRLPIARRPPRLSLVREKPLPAEPLLDSDLRTPTRRGLSVSRVASHARTLDVTWIKALSEEERQAVIKWTRYRYQRPMMKYIETGVGDSTTAKNARALLSALDKAPKVEATVYRGLADIPDGVIADIKRRAAKQGRVSVASIRSSSLSSDIAHQFAAQTKRGGNAVVIELRTKTGVRIDDLSCYPWQKEVLLRKGQEYRIMGFAEEQAKGGRRWYRVIVEEL
jgi:SPP1 gp7 family putative phage head morphogenesis protein